MLPCFVAMHSQDVRRLDHRFGSQRDLVLSVSVKMMSDQLYGKSSEVRNVTLFCCNALARCSAP